MTLYAPPRPLHPTQQKVIDAVWQFWRDHGYGPSLQDLRRATGIRSNSTVVYNLDRLEAKGLVRLGRERGYVIARAIVPIGDSCPCCGRGGQ